MKTCEFALSLFVDALQRHIVFQNVDINLSEIIWMQPTGAVVFTALTLNWLGKYSHIPIHCQDNWRLESFYALLLLNHLHFKNVTKNMLTFVEIYFLIIKTWIIDRLNWLKLTEPADTVRVWSVDDCSFPHSTGFQLANT